LPSEPPLEKPGHESVARAEHVVDLDRETASDNAIFDAIWNRGWVDYTSHGTAF
jgi:hypothetical protein